MADFPHRAVWNGQEYQGLAKGMDASQEADQRPGSIPLFLEALSGADGIASAIEFKARAGQNLYALRAAYPKIHVRGVEINSTLVGKLENEIGAANVIRSSIFDADVGEPADLAFVKGVMIYLDPNRRPAVYEALYKASKRFILIIDDFNPAPITRHSQWHLDAIYKRDYAGEMLDQFRDLTLVDYGFRYRRDPEAPEHNALWFLMRKP